MKNGVSLKRMACKHSLDSLVVKQLIGHLTHKGAKQPGAILLKGEWGVGKTYLWKTRIAPALKGNRYLYISLFGVGSVAELRSRLMTNLVGEMSSSTSKWKGAFDIGAQLVKNLPKVVAAGAKGVIEKQFGKDVLSYLDGLHIELDPLQFFPSDVVVCFDDLERKKLSDDELLGVINFLTEQKNARVLLIANESKLSDTFKVFKEKVVWLTLKWETPANTVVKSFIDSLAIPKNRKHIYRCKDVILECLGSAKHQNLRTLQRIIRLLDQIASLKKVTLDLDRVRFLTALVIEDAKNGGLKYAPEIYNGAKYFFATFAGKKKPEELVGEDRVSFEFYNTYFEGKHNTGFSKVLFGFVQDGFLEESELLAELAPPDKRDQGARLFEEIQSGAWMFGNDVGTAALINRVVSFLNGAESTHIGCVLRLRGAMGRLCRHIDTAIPDVSAAIERRICERAKIPDKLDMLDRGFDDEKERAEVEPYFILYKQTAKSEEKARIKTTILTSLRAGKETDFTSEDLRYNEVVLDVLADPEILDAAEAIIDTAPEPYFRFFHSAIKRATERPDQDGSKVLNSIRTRLNAKKASQLDKSSLRRLDWLFNKLPAETKATGL